MTGHLFVNCGLPDMLGTGKLGIYREFGESEKVREMLKNFLAKLHWPGELSMYSNTRAGYSVHDLAQMSFQKSKSPGNP